MVATGSVFTTGAISWISSSYVGGGLGRLGAGDAWRVGLRGRMGTEGRGVGLLTGVGVVGLLSLEELPWVSPFTFNSSATAKKEFNSSWATFTSPWYMKFKTAVRSVNATPFR